MLLQPQHNFQYRSHLSPYDQYVFNNLSSIVSTIIDRHLGVVDRSAMDYANSTDVYRSYMYRLQANPPYNPN